jgi:predicted amidohydrolase YtcJ
MKKSGSIALIDANIIPMVEQERVHAILIIDGRIDTIGDNETIIEKANSNDIKIINAMGYTILPSFYDLHVHALTTGMNALGVDLYDVKDIPELLTILQSSNVDKDPSQWVFGKRLDESRLAEGRPPTMQELNEIDHPVFISDRGKHYCLVNQKGWEILGLAKDIRGVRLNDNGNPNGRLQDDANKIGSGRFFSLWPRKLKQEAIKTTINLALSKGITSIGASEGLDSSDEDVYMIHDMLNELPLDFTIRWNTDTVEKPYSLGYKFWGSDLLLDGSIGSRTAAFNVKYEDADTCGALNYSDQKVFEILDETLKRDMIVSFHCIGEKAIKQAIDQIERVLKKYPEKRNNHQLQLEHVGWPSQDDINRMSTMNIMISTQPAFTYLRGGPQSVYRKRLGEKREKRGYPLRRFLDAGIIVGGGSDSDVTPMDALLGIHAAVNQPYPENSVTPYEAVRMFTSHAAQCGYEFEKKGTLEPGKQGDLVLLSADPLTCDPRKIKDINVLVTIHKGLFVYLNDEFIQTHKEITLDQ